MAYRPASELRLAPIRDMADFRARAAYLAREEAKFFLSADLDLEKATWLEQRRSPNPRGERLRRRARQVRIAGATTSHLLVRLEKMAEDRFGAVPDYPTPDALREINARRRQRQIRRSSDPRGSARG